MRSCDATILGQFDSRFVQVQAMFDRFNMIQHPNSTTSVADFFLGACWRCRTSAGPVCASYFWGLLCFSRQLMTQGGIPARAPQHCEHEWNQMNKDMTQRLLLGLARAVWPSCDSALGSPKWPAMDSAEESLWLCGCGVWMNPKQIEYNFCVFLDRVVFTFANSCFHELNKFKALMIHKTTLISHTRGNVAEQTQHHGGFYGLSILVISLQLEGTSAKLGSLLFTFAHSAISQ